MARVNFEWRVKFNVTLALLILFNISQNEILRLPVDTTFDVVGKPHYLNNNVVKSQVWHKIADTVWIAGYNLILNLVDVWEAMYFELFPPF